VSPVDARAAAYGAWIAALSVLSLACVLGIMWAEMTSVQHPEHRLVGGALIGIVLLAYSFILLFLRKGGFTGV
jgi:hypothetical protein